MITGTYASSTPGCLVKGLGLALRSDEIHCVPTTVATCLQNRHGRLGSLYVRSQRSIQQAATASDIVRAVSYRAAVFRSPAMVAYRNTSTPRVKKAAQ